MVCICNSTGLNSSILIPACFIAASILSGVCKDFVLGSMAFLESQAITCFNFS